MSKLILILKSHKWPLLAGTCITIFIIMALVRVALHLSHPHHQLNLNPQNSTVSVNTNDVATTSFNNAPSAASSIFMENASFIQRARQFARTHVGVIVAVAVGVVAVALVVGFVVYKVFYKGGELDDALGRVEVGAGGKPVDGANGGDGSAPASSSTVQAVSAYLIPIVIVVFFAVIIIAVVLRVHATKKKIDP
jgi:hypothetical protein